MFSVKMSLKGVGFELKTNTRALASRGVVERARRKGALRAEERCCLGGVCVGMLAGLVALAAPERAAAVESEASELRTLVKQAKDGQMVDGVGGLDGEAQVVSPGHITTSRLRSQIYFLDSTPINNEVRVRRYDVMKNRVSTLVSTTKDLRIRYVRDITFDESTSELFLSTMPPDGASWYLLKVSLGGDVTPVGGTMAAENAGWGIAAKDGASSSGQCNGFIVEG